MLKALRRFSTIWNCRVSACKRLHLSLTAAICLLIAACGDVAVPAESEDASALINTYGLTAAPVYQPLVKRALAFADSALGASPSPIRLRAGWELGADGGSAATVPVHVVTDGLLSKLDIAFVLEGCQAIIVQGPAFEDWLSDIEGPKETRSLSVDPAATLAFLLLHETGHVAASNCHDASFVAGKQVLTLSENDSKANEIRADQFAAQALNATQGKRWEVRNAAMSVEMAVSTLSFLVSGNRIVSHPGASLLGSRDVFWDLGYTHPNLEWRLLSMSYALHPSPDAQQVLSDFDSNRHKGVNEVFLDLRPRQNDVAFPELPSTK
jgi:hypothetical protein